MRGWACAGTATLLVVASLLPLSEATAVTPGIVQVIPTACLGYMYSPAAAVGSPGRDVGGVPDAGAVVVRVPNATDDLGTVLASADLGRPAGPQDRFGASVSWANLTVGDRVGESYGPRLGSCPDLVIGVPGANGARGAVVVVPDLGAGLEPARAVWLAADALALRPGDGLGTALGVSVSPATSMTTSSVTLVAGVPGRDLPGAANAGALYAWTFPTAPGDLSVAPVLPAAMAHLVLTQGAAGIEGRAEAADRFGSVIASGNPLLVGIPREDIGGRANVGAVASITFAGGSVASDELLWLGHGLPGRAREGDLLGSAVWGGSGVTAIGAPGRDCGRWRDAGAVLVRWQWTVGEDWTQPASWHVLTQDSPGVPGRCERADAFGSAVTWIRGRRGAETSAVAIGIPGEDTGRRGNAGEVLHLDLFSERDDSEGRWAFLRQPAPPRLRSGDRFGSSFVRVPGDPGDDEDATDLLLAGAPGHDVTGARNAGRSWNLGPAGVSLFATGVTPQERMGR